MSYSIGMQPCADFRAKDELFPGSGNVHECFAPFRGAGPRCAETHGGTVSWCENCNHDHHAGGWDTCAGGFQNFPSPMIGEASGSRTSTD